MLSDNFNPPGIRQFQNAADTKSFFPPIFLQEFWGPRSFGALDDHLANLKKMNIVPEPMKDKAVKLNAPNNWAVIIPERLADNPKMLQVLKPLQDLRQGK